MLPKSSLYHRQGYFTIWRETGGLFETIILLCLLEALEGGVP